MRLINPFLAELAQLDTAATNLDPDGAGPKTSGYDHVFREPIKVNPVGGLGTSARQEKPLIRVASQVEIGVFDALRQYAAGAAWDSRMSLVMDFSDLEERGLVDMNGEATIRVGDRLNAIYHYDDESLVQRIRNPPGLFVVEVAPQSFGIGRRRGLLFVRFDERMPGTK